MFQEGATPGRVDAATYGHEYEDFSQDATQLDVWVFDRVKALFDEAKTNKTLNEQLRQDKLVFFLHLLGLDTNGHAYRPYSKEYLHNIQLVDEGVREITELIDDFYNDGKTAFVFTADHGMSDFGSHGDGHPDNTRTPLITWGSGIAKPVKVMEGIAPGHDELSSDWGLDHITRHDVAQADIAALMAYLAGLDFPTNSVGELPLDFLAADLPEKAEAALQNARGILEMYRIKEEQKKANEMRYMPYPGLGEGTRTVAHRTATIRRLIDAGEYERSIVHSQELMQVGIQGLRYLQTYDWLFLRALITIGYLGWIAFALTTVIDLHVLHGTARTTRTRNSVVFFSSILIAMYASFIISHSPPTYYAYALFPVAFWEEVYARRTALKAGGKKLFGHVKSAKGWVGVVTSSIATVAFVEALALGYTHREVFSILYIAAAAWPLLYGKQFIQENRLLLATWFAACVAMSSFTTLPVVKVEDVNQILYGGALMVMIGLGYMAFEKKILGRAKFQGDSTAPADSLLSRILIGVQVGLIILSMIVTRSSALSLQAKAGLPRGNQVVGWMILVTSLAMPFLHRLQPNNHYLHRLMVLFLTFSPIFVILTISYEGLFYFTFCVTLLTWVRIEHKIYITSKPAPVANPWAMPSPSPNGKLKSRSAQKKRLLKEQEPNGSALPPALSTPTYRSLTLTDARISLFFLTLLQSAFFSTGNIASISSFSLDSVYRLLPIFDPFSQGGLLILKLMIPFALISANLGILNKRIGVAPSALFMVVMAVSDGLTMHFFWVVRDEGSWLEIGSTISHFVIASLLCVFVAVLEGVSELFIGGVEVHDEQVHNEKELGGLVVDNESANKGKGRKRN